ncbi:MAG: endonuclease MutS2, partial [Bacteroidota bacterium]
RELDPSHPDAVKDTASKDLREIRRSIIRKADELRLRLEAILKGYSQQGYAQEEIITTRDGRMVIPVKVEHKHHVPGFIHSSSATGATVFIEPAETLEVNNEIRTLQFSEQREVERILRTLTAQIRGARNELLSNIDILAQIDFSFAKAKYSTEIIGAQPMVTSRGPIRLLQARHPILLQKHKRDGVVPLTIEIGNQFNTLVITGPNAGGKTVALKTVGLLSLMVACGFHVPASADSEIPLLKQIFIDIGDEQSIENDLSSFTSHLLNLKQILEQTDDQTLVLIDEIGAGTDPTEGGALAAAVLSKLTTTGSLTIATTHHGALKAFAHETPGFENGAMEFDQATLRPTYHFKSGIPGSSYAIEIAGRLGLPESILSSARDLLGPKREKLESLLAAVEERFQHLQQEHRQVQEQNSILARLIEQYESKLKAVDHEIKDTRVRALLEARDVIDKANALIEASVKEIKAKSAEKDVVRHAKVNVAAMKERIDSELHAFEDNVQRGSGPQVFREGDLVRLKDHNGVGQVISSSEDGKTLVVKFGDLRVQASSRNLELASESDQQSRPIPLPPETKMVKTEIDLRGMTSEEAIAAVDKFLDDAWLAALRSVSLIHGKGTGTLRKRIAEYLKSNHRVKSYRLADWNLGGSGATVVDLQD